MSNFQSVFDGATNAEKDFDYTFGAMEDEELMDTVMGFKEDGSVNLPDYAELHQTDREATPDDLRDELGEDHDTNNKPAADSNGDFDLEDEGLDLACPKFGVADAVEKNPTVDPEDIESASDKAADKMEKSYNEALASLLEEAEDELGEGDPGDVADPEAKEECSKVKKEDGAENPIVDELEDDVHDDAGEIKTDTDPKNGAEGTDGESLVDGLEEEVEDLGVEDKDMGVEEDKTMAPDPEDDDQEQLQDDPEDIGLDEANLSEDDPLVDELEDDIIDEVETDGTISAAEKKELDTDEFDDELISMVAGK